MILLSLQRLCILLLCWAGCAATTPAPMQAGEEAAVKSTIGQLFEGMRKGDSSMVKAAFAPGAVLQTIATPAGGGTEVKTASLQRFLDAVGSPHTDVWDEQIEYGHIAIDGELASVWTPYRFYLGKAYSHCGVNSFQLVKLEGVWKIAYLIDTRRKNCGN
ncbi:nuclear transport factor 2 family protein [Chitinophaga japonensis]|uniref:Putative lumazine-binding protein n=1 Tax=Chitinophaga japonensis TaxID=104662 RepID=A0A562SUC8_CHIJA|nr:nuclear transport factor 2 family protein [Chitinophaga japonensis]TWI84316.1 putative lumazine-binding protein [Chitinophaga japonensis]